ncbi:MAG: FAD-dependent monooxygenase [Sphingomonadales bacterium]|nr:FAD-dependent monooxygenase [Sphingomonadales bacterium]
MTANDSHDVIISGGGLVGMTLALALAQGGLRSLVADRDAPARALDPEFDGRASAIAFAGYKLFDAIGLWPALKDNAQPIEEIRVSDGASLLHLHFDQRELGEGPLGFMLENRRIRLALHEAAAGEPLISLRAPARIASATRETAGVKIELENGEVATARLLIAAEGRRSPLREAAGIKLYAWSYDQTGIVVTAHHERPHRAIAHEHFLPAGPFAILPLTGNRSSLVWTERTKTANTLLKLPQGLFDAELRRRFGDFLGHVQSEGPRWSYPLDLQIAEHYTERRLALIGDAAHGIHPIAGQGLNLGLKDIAALAQVLAEAARAGEDIGGNAALERYARWRRFDNMTLSVVCDSLVRLFSNDIAPVRIARDLGLAAVNRLPPLKRFFMHHARGTVGELPRLLRGEAL